MADKIILKGCQPYDGTYDFDSGYFTNREFHTIKRIAGVRAGELEDALAAADLDVMVAIAVIALQRHGKQVDEDVIWDAEGGASIVFVGEEAEQEAVPPTVAPQNGSSGGASRDSSALPVSLPKATGVPV